MHVVALSPSAVCTSSSVASNVRAISPHASCASACPELKPSVSEQKGQGKSVVSTTWIPCSIRRPIQFREPQMRSLWLRGTLSSYLHLKDQGSSDPLLLGGAAVLPNPLLPGALVTPRGPGWRPSGASPCLPTAGLLLPYQAMGSRAGARGLTAFVFSAQASRASRRAASLTTARPGKTITKNRVSETAL